MHDLRSSLCGSFLPAVRIVIAVCAVSVSTLSSSMRLIVSKDYFCFFYVGTCIANRVTEQFVVGIDKPTNSVFNRPTKYSLHLCVSLMTFTLRTSRYYISANCTLLELQLSIYTKYNNN